MRGGQVQNADAEYLDRLREMTYEPIFIIGDHRSGTTLLYQLLARSNAFNITTTYHVIGYRSLLAEAIAGRTDQAKEDLNERFRQLHLDTRVIDEFELNAETPEEYGIILHGETGRLTLESRTRHAFDEMCRKIQFVSGTPGRPLLLKNPWDFPHFLRVHELFPDAKLVFIHRHPVHVLNSQLKAMRQNWHEGNAYIEMLSETFSRMQRSRLIRSLMRWGTDPESRVRLSQRLVTRRSLKSMRYFLNHVDQIPDGLAIHVAYESLCENADQEIDRVLRFLGAKECQESLQGEIAPRPVRLLPGIEANARTLDRRYAPLYARHGYAPISDTLRSETPRPVWSSSASESVSR